MIVKKYKKEFLLKYGDNVSPYKSKKNKSNGLIRWFDEKWSRDKKGNTGYNKKDDVYRPLIRVNKKTPITWFELSNKEISKAKKEKKETGRVLRFKKEFI
jgi:aromatic ring-opening dioxygenase LigB subunit